MRRKVLRALTGVVFASATVFACGDDAVPAQAPTSTVVLDAPTSTPVPNPTPFIASDPRISLKVVEAILPSPAATSATLRLAPGAWVLRNPDPWVDYGASGVTAGWGANFEPLLTPTADATPEGIGLSLTFHGTADEAERTYQNIRGAFGIQPREGDERETVADAVSMVPAYGVIIIRQGTVTAMVFMNAGGPEVRADLREFARMLAAGIDEFVRSQGP